MPVDVIGLPDTLKREGTVIPTLVTVPPEPVAAIVIAPEALVIVTPLH